MPTQIPEAWGKDACYSDIVRWFPLLDYTHIFALSFMGGGKSISLYQRGVVF